MQVFDVRGTSLRPVVTLPVSALGGTPTALAFHPLLPSMLLVTGPRGGLVTADVGAGATQAAYQVSNALYGQTKSRSCFFVLFRCPQQQFRGKGKLQ